MNTENVIPISAEARRYKRYWKVSSAVADRVRAIEAPIRQAIAIAQEALNEAVEGANEEIEVSDILRDLESAMDRLRFIHER